MFLELCQAYTSSINQGSVPNIENAWTSLCKNENLRGINQAVASYEKQMSESSYADPEKTQCIEYSELKKLNRDVTASVLATFKQTALGD